MPFILNSSLFRKNNARNIKHMTVLIFSKCLDLRRNVYSRTASLAAQAHPFFCGFQIKIAWVKIWATG